MKSHVENLFNVPTNIKNNKSVLFDVKAPFHDQCEMIRKQLEQLLEVLHDVICVSAEVRHKKKIGMSNTPYTVLIRIKT